MHLSEYNTKILMKAFKKVAEDKELMKDILEQALVPKSDREYKHTADLINRLWFNNE